MLCDIVRVWNHKILSPEQLRAVSGFIQDGLEFGHGEEDLDSIYKAIEDGNIHLWIVYNGSKIQGAYTTQIIDYSHLATLRIVTLAGESFPDWIEQAHTSLVQFARDNKVSRIDLVGRKGWIKRLAHLGFREAYTVVVKEIE